MVIIFLIGRIIVGAYFLMNGYNHIAKASHMAGYASAKGVPSPKAAVLGSGLLLLAGGLSIIFGIFPFWGIIALLVFLVPVTVAMHPFWKEKDAAARGAEQIAFMKNLALIGFLLMTLSLTNLVWPYSI